MFSLGATHVQLCFSVECKEQINWRNFFLCT